MLQAKRVLAADVPLSVKPDTKNKRYRIADPYLRFWLAFLARAIPLIERGRGYDALVRDMLAVPGTTPDTPLVAVSRCGVTDDLPLTAHRALGARGPRTGVAALTAATYGRRSCRAERCPRGRLG